MPSASCTTRRSSAASASTAASRTKKPTAGDRYLGAARHAGAGHGMVALHRPTTIVTVVVSVLLTLLPLQL